MCQPSRIAATSRGPKSQKISDHMRKIRTKRTGVENRVRSILRRDSRRFKGNVQGLPGRPDLLLPESNLVIFVNGCFWHGCPKCFRAPNHNRRWWLEKIEANRRRDVRVSRALRRMGYSVVHIWEHDSDSRIRARITAAINRQSG